MMEDTKQKWMNNWNMRLKEQEQKHVHPQVPCKRATGRSPALGESLHYTRKQLYRFHPRTPPRKKQPKPVGKKK